MALINQWLNVEGTLNADGVTFRNRTIFHSGGQGTIKNSNIASFEIQIRDGASVSLDNNTFHAGIPIYVTPENVPTLAGKNNMFLSGATIGVLGGSISQDTVWPVISGASKYRMDNVTINSGATLTLHPAVEVRTSLINQQFDVHGTLDADSVTFRNRIIVHSGGHAAIKNSALESFDIQLRDGASANLVHNTFHAGIPIYVTPEYVPTLAEMNNTFLSGATIGLFGGTIGQDTVWPVISGASKYLMNGVTINPGATLTLRPSVEVRMGLINQRFDVHGTLDADGVTFRSRIIFRPGGQGTIQNSTLDSFDIQIYGGASPDLDHNTFHGGIPIHVTPEYVPTLAAMNNTYGCGATIGIFGGTVGQNTVWPNIPGAPRYRLSSEMTVDSGAALTIAPGVTVTIALANHSMRINGTLNADSVLFDTTTTFGRDSGGSVRRSRFNRTVQIDSETQVTFTENHFAQTVIAVGDAARTIDLTQSDWGTNDGADIEHKIVHRPDNPQHPLVLFEPFLPTDTLPPTPILSGPAGPTNLDPFEIAIQFGESVIGFERCDLAVDNGIVNELTDHGGGNFTATIDAKSDGDVTIALATAAATDPAGNVSDATDPLLIVVDTTAPLVSAPEHVTVEGNTTGGATLLHAAIIAFLADATATDNIDLAVTVTHDAPTFFPLGTTIVTFTGHDDAGNFTSDSATVTVVDTTAPTVTAHSDIIVEGHATGGAAENHAPIDAFLKDATASDIVDDSLAITIDAPHFFPLGNSVVTFSATDDSGNTGATTATVTVIDTTAPTLTAPADIVVEGHTTGGAAETHAAIVAFLNGATAHDIVDESITIMNDAPSFFPIGNTIVTFSASDHSHNTITRSAVVTVVDTTSPTLTAPADILVEGGSTGGAARNHAAIDAFLKSATTNDFVDSSPTLTHDAPELFPLGVTNVTFTATDDSGNTTTDTAVVTVIDATAPTLTVPTDITVEGDTTGGASKNNPAIDALLNGVIPSDIVDDSVSVEHDAPALFLLGATVITFSATDDSGNTGTKTATVTVVDSTAPQLTTPVDIVVEANVLDGAEANLPSIDDFLSGANAIDIVDPGPVITHDAPSLLPIGNTTIVFTATDAAGNVNTATSVISVTVSYDFGDAPTAAHTGFPASYPVSRIHNGARHLVGSLFLGTRVDAEGDGQSDAEAGQGEEGGDDNNLLSDEDGVVAMATIVTTVESETTSSFQVVASEPGKLDSWIDFNRDGDWDDPGEQISTNFDLTAGANLLSYSVPAGSIGGETGARFRLSTSGGLTPTGPADDGEIEDYLVTIVDGDTDKANVVIDVLGDHARLAVQAGNLIVLDGSDPVFLAPLDRIDTIELQANVHDQSITLDYSDGNPVPSGSLRIVGGEGEDSIRLVGHGSVLDLTNATIQLIGVETIDLSSAMESSLVIDASSVTNLDLTHPVGVVGGEGDRLEIVGGEGGTIDFVDAANHWQMSDPVVGERYERTVVNGDVTIRANLPFPYQNLLQGHDVNVNGTVTANDTLIVINELARRQFSDSTGRIIDPLSLTVVPDFFFDVSGDDRITALDALLGINQLAKQNSVAAGESILDIVAIQNATDTQEQRSASSPSHPLTTGKTNQSSFGHTMPGQAVPGQAAPGQAIPGQTTNDSDDYRRDESRATTSVVAVDELLSDQKHSWISPSAW